MKSRTDTLTEINQLTGHWRRKLCLLETYLYLNGQFDAVVMELDEIEDRLDALWLARRKELAKPDAHRFKDEPDSFTNETAELVHVKPCS